MNPITEYEEYIKRQKLSALESKRNEPVSPRFNDRVLRAVESAERKGIPGKGIYVVTPDVDPSGEKSIWRRIGERTFYRAFGTSRAHGGNGIQEALMKAHSRIFLLDGIYYPTTSISIPTVAGSYTTDSPLQTVSHKYIEGESFNVQINGSKLPSGSGYVLGMINTSGTVFPPHIVLRDFQIDAANIASYGIEINLSPEGSYPGLIERMIVSNTTNAAFYIAGAEDMFLNKLWHLYNNLTHGSYSLYVSDPSGSIYVADAILENITYMNAQYGDLKGGTIFGILVQGNLFHFSDLDLYDLSNAPAFQLAGGTVGAELDNINFTVHLNPYVLDLHNSLFGQWTRVKNSTVNSAYQGTQYIVGDPGGTGRGTAIIEGMGYSTASGTTLQLNQDNNIIIALKNTFVPGGPFFITLSQLTNGAYTSFTTGQSYPNLIRADVIVYVTITLNPTSSAASASIIVNGVTVGTVQAPAGTATGQEAMLVAYVPGGQSFKVTVSNATAGGLEILPVG